VLDDIADWVTTVVETLGYVGVAFLVALENVFPPIPSEVILPLAGFVAGEGGASLWGMIVAATIGSVVGAWVLYGISAAIGPDRLHRFLVRYGRWFGVKERDLLRAEDWFDRRAGTAVLIGRCVPLIRSVVSVPAGFRRMPLLRFTLYTALGSLIWNTTLIGAGAILGERWKRVGDVVGLLQGVVIVAVVGGVLFLLWRWLVLPRLPSSLRPGGAGDDVSDDGRGTGGGGAGPVPDGRG
jgi:membrane protein DedA with SNARE-associated domain